jgi:hypothetical protein
VKRHGSIGRRVRNARRRARLVHEPGREPVRIDDLVSPLRYDVLVRERFLACLRQADGDVADALESPAGVAYRTWFREIVVRRFKPDLIGREQEIEEALAARVRASGDLVASFEAAGYDPRRPITLFSGRKLLPTTTGKRLGGRLFAGDGCHRLALLRLHGIDVLQPDSYRVQVAPRYAPLDNTAELIPMLGVELEEYLDFLALTYAPGRASTTRDELLEQTADLNPERVDELAAILVIDRPLLPE